MNNDKNMVELTDEQLESATGGTTYSSHGVNINVDVPINVNASPTVNLALFSKDVHQSGATVNQNNFAWQNIK